VGAKDDPRLTGATLGDHILNRVAKHLGFLNFHIPACLPQNIRYPSHRLRVGLGAGDPRAEGHLISRVLESTLAIERAAEIDSLPSES
jgi:hypothetical protein